MTQDKTVTMSRELLDAATVAVGEWGDSLLSRCNPGHGTAMLDLERELRDVLNADPVPPAGGEMEDDIGGLISVMRNAVRDDANNGGIENFEKARAAENDLRAHVTRLQAEVERLKDRLADANSTARLAVTNLKEFKEDHQSELTKARELLHRTHAADTAERHHLPYNVSKLMDDIEAFLQANRSAPADDSYPPCDYCGTVPDYHPWHGSGMINGQESPHIHACNECRAKLPAPADKGQPVAWMYRREGGECLGQLVQMESDSLKDVREGKVVEGRRLLWPREDYIDWMPLYTEQPAPVAVVMPERMEPRDPWDDESNQWNACLDEVARLNGVKP